MRNRPYTPLMDNVTHSITGYALGRAGLAPEPGRAMTLYILIVSSLPDIDYLQTQIQGGPHFLYHRLWTHSVLGVPLLSLAAALVGSLFFPRITRARLFLVALVAMVVHVFLDVTTSYGTGLLYPFSDQRVAACWLFIIDPLLWLCCLLPPFVARFVPRFPARPAWRLAVLIAALYVLACGGLHHRALTLTRAAAPAALTWALPEPLSPLFWRGIVRQGDTYTVSLVDVARGTRQPLLSLRTDDADSLVARLRRSPAGRDLDWFFLIPVWQRDAHSIEAFDLQFSSALLTRGRPIHAFHFSADDPAALDQAALR